MLRTAVGKSIRVSRRSFKNYFNERDVCTDTKHVALPHWYKRMTNTNEYNLPPLPVPMLSETLTRYLESVEPFMDRDNLEKYKEVVKQFEVGEGRQLQDALLQQHFLQTRSKSYPFSYIEEIWDKMYLGGRSESPVNVNPAYGLRNGSGSGERCGLTRAAHFAESLVKWWDKVKQSKLEQDPNQCMSFYAKQLGTSKIPNLICDKLVSHPRSAHIVVLKENAMYKLNVLSSDGKKALRKEAIFQQLEWIMNDSSRDQDVDISSLTAAKRDTWSHVRSKMMQHDEVNARSIADIDAALFVLVLERREATSKKESAELSLHGKGKWRWFDKLQVIASLAGHISINFEHSFSDGTVWNRWLHEVWHDMHGSDSGYAPLVALPEYQIEKGSKPDKLRWNLSSNLVDQIKEAEHDFSLLASNVSTEYLESESASKRSCKMWRLSPDGVAQMGFQLAFYRQHRKVPPTYESCSTRAFLHGRTETIRSATPAAANFIKAVEQNASKECQRDLLVKAVENHVRIAKLAQNGLGVDRHLTALASIANKRGISSSLLVSPQLAASKNFQLSSSNVTMPFLQYFTFGAVVPDGYGLGYLTHENALHVAITSFKSSSATNASAYKTLLEKSYQTISDLANNAP
uniref:Choline/Carnitine Oacyltransferase putative n=1 Tax=Albugo laibachii Nc14 TaxID=890382 RepID=F0W3G1_9STRA|nr:choline/Carnitine Oacyltransferase putative [Albugo laibachii Nc14]CCA16336.1 choline/Carnitine Oacyltransferase putative [Albugo laibachii Nc14]|eukprot:CCA16336.1 choline/Carnitine Oacyltransferase putative [Albugo laibachii Nc14]